MNLGCRDRVDSSELDLPGKFHPGDVDLGQIGILWLPHFGPYEKFELFMYFSVVGEQRCA